GHVSHCSPPFSRCSGGAALPTCPCHEPAVQPATPSLSGNDRVVGSSGAGRRVRSRGVMDPVRPTAKPPPPASPPNCPGPAIHQRQPSQDPPNPPTSAGRPAAESSTSTWRTP